ncbi:MAG TPA: hypothetical protein VNO55_04475 [Polyangia bacterium]|nr:hypothetical protein [Polyangia bacterium]
MTWLTLQLTDEEARALGVALELHLHGVRTELASADDREYKNSLRQQLEVLEAIAGRLPSALPKTATTSGAGTHRRDRTVHPESAEDETEALLASSPPGQRNREALAANPDTAEEEAERLLARAHRLDDDRTDD